MKPRIHRFHLGPKVLPSQKSKALALIFPKMTYCILNQVESNQMIKSLKAPWS